MIASTRFFFSFPFFSLAPAQSETVLQAVPGPNGGIQLILTRRPKRLRNGDDSPSGPNPERAVIIEPLDPPGPEASSSPRLVEMADDRDTTPEDQIKRTVAAAPSSMADDEVVIKEGGPGPGEGDTPSSRQLSYLAAGAKDEATFDEEPGTFTGPHAGCTAITAMIRGRTLVVANAGDSRCLLSHQGTVVPLSFDHKPTDAAENFRIVKAGGQVFDGRCVRCFACRSSLCLRVSACEPHLLFSSHVSHIEFVSR